MFKPNTVLVIGAGASAEVGMPLGTELADQIVGLVDFKRDELTGRLPEHNDFVRSMMNFAGQQGLAQYERAAAQIVSGVRSAESVDRFIDRFREDDFIRTMGKAAIINSIALKERKSKLFVDKGGSIKSKWPIEDTWYWTFAKMLLEGNPPREKLFDDIAIVCFNYDRCIEHYLTCELMRSYFINHSDATQLVNRLTIWHPYGTIAPLDISSTSGTAFGDNEALSRRYFQLAPRIKTFTEEHEDGAMTAAIRARIRAAETVVFLGFGFYKQNLDLIEPEGPTSIKWILGTGFGLSDSGRSVVIQRLADWAKVGNHPPNIDVPHMKCAETLNYYRLALSA